MKSLGITIPEKFQPKITQEMLQKEDAGILEQTEGLKERESVLDLEIDNVGFSERLKNVLLRGRFETVRDIIDYINKKTVNGLYDLFGYGKVAEKELLAKLKELGVQL